MRAKLVPIVIALLCAVIFGCARAGDDGSPAPNPGPAPSAGDEQEAYPDEVRTAIETIKPMEVGVPIIVDQKTYVIAGFGEQPTGGYEVNLDTKTEGQNLIATVDLKEPASGEAVTQAHSYPYAVKVLDDVFAEVQFRTAGGEEFPQIVGLRGPLASVKRSENSNIVVTALEQEGEALHVAGIARVFEAVVGYELQDASERVLAEGPILAATAGSHWGFFEKEFTAVPAGATKMVLFQPSAKDGSKLDIVELELKPQGA